MNTCVTCVTCVTFVEDLEFIYENKLVYRTMVVCGKSNKQSLKSKMEDYGHTVIVLDDINTDFDYEKMDARVLIVSDDMFKDVVEHFADKYGLNDISYNFVAFAYDLDNDVSANLKTWYKEKNNSEDVIII